MTYLFLEHVYEFYHSLWGFPINAAFISVHFITITKKILEISTINANNSFGGLGYLMIESET